MKPKTRQPDILFEWHHGYFTNGIDYLAKTVNQK